MINVGTGEGDVGTSLNIKEVMLETAGLITSLSFGVAAPQGRLHMKSGNRIYTPDQGSKAATGAYIRGCEAGLCLAVVRCPMTAATDHSKTLRLPTRIEAIILKTIIL